MKRGKEYPCRREIMWHTRRENLQHSGNSHLFTTVHIFRYGQRRQDIKTGSDLEVQRIGLVLMPVEMYPSREEVVYLYLQSIIIETEGKSL